MRYAMNMMRACDVQMDFLAALPVLRELTINYYPLHRAWNHKIMKLFVGILYNKMKERPDLGLPPVRVHLCGLAMGDLQDAFEWSQWYKPSDCTLCTIRYHEVSWA